jgi:hypothetical protein
VGKTDLNGMTEDGSSPLGVGPACRSAALAAIHETAQALRDIGAIDPGTMREFDEACLAPPPPTGPLESPCGSVECRERT